MKKELLFLPQIQDNFIIHDIDRVTHQVLVTNIEYLIQCMTTNHSRVNDIYHHNVIQYRNAITKHRVHTHPVFLQQD